MEQNNEILHSHDDREVVLRYSPAVEPVVERYIQPTPLPGQQRQSAQKTTRRRKRGKRIFFFSILALALLCAGVGICWAAFGGGDEAGSAPDGYGSYRDRDFENRDGSRGDSDRGATTIRRAPYTDEVKLTYSETHGAALSAEEIYERVNPSTVTVITGMNSGGAMIGTGVIMTEDGYVLTNAHVIAGGADCQVVLDSGYNYPARLVGLDEDKDLAVLKLVGASGLPAAEFGDSDALKVGEAVYAIGNPLGVELRGTLTDGIVSAIDRDVYVDGVTMTLIQTNAALNNGNSGGPLINQYGQVVGINTMKMGSSSTTSVEGLGFAIPIASAAYMVNDLLACGEIRGEVVIGITVLRLPDTLPSGETALEVQEVTPGGPGEEAGVQVGDYVVTADGETLSSSNDLIRIRRRHDAGETLTLVIDRNGERFTAEVVLRVLDG